MPVWAVIGNVFMLQGFAEEKYAFNWYLTALVVFYFLTPFLAELVKSISKASQFILLIFTLLIISYVFLRSGSEIKMMIRLPIYVEGMYFAKLEKYDHKKVTKHMIVTLVLILGTGLAALLFSALFFKEYLVSYGLLWYPFVLITPGLCVLMSYIAKGLERGKILHCIVIALSTVGVLSFEIYLVHIFFLDIYSTVFVERNLIMDSNGAICIVLAAAGMGSILLHYIAKGMSQKICRNIAVTKGQK